MNHELNSQQLLLLEFVKEQHGDQVRKYTERPYWYHLVEVADLVRSYGYNSIEIALCHDLLEDTSCTSMQLYDKLRMLGYSSSVCIDICGYVNNLTDHFTKETYPDLNRKERKFKEAERLGKFNFVVHTIKLADLISNMNELIPYDKGFGFVFLNEMKELLVQLRKANKEMYSLALDCYSHWIVEINDYATFTRT